MLNLYRYLHLVFQKVISAEYPEVSTKQYSLRFFLSQDEANDLCTPVARQIQSLLISTTAETIAHRLIERTDWDSTYISSVNSEIVIHNGFINFNISHIYLQEILFQGFPAPEPCTSSTVHSAQFCPLYHKLKRLMLYAESTGMLEKKPDQSGYVLLTNKEEHSILVLLTLLDFPELNSGKLYLIKRLLTLTENYYSKTQLISKDTAVSAIRLLLIKRVLEKIETHPYSQFE